MQVKKRHGCDFVVKLERTLGTVRDGLVRVTLSGRHATNPSAWAALPFEHRRPSPSTKRSIVQLMGVKSTARQAQLQLNLAAKGAEGLGPGEAVADRSKAPTKKVIQQTMTDRRRSGRR